MGWKTLETANDNSIYLKLKEGTTRVRVISEPTLMWVSFGKDATGKNTAKKYLDEAIARTDPKAKKKFALWVIDREDGKVKLAEFGASIIIQLQTLANDADYGFDSLPPYDVKITRVGGGMETKYTVMNSPPTELSGEEKAKTIDLEPVDKFLMRQPGIVLKANNDLNEIPF